MSFKFNLSDKVSACLQSQLGKRFTARQIAEWIFEHYPEDCERKRRESKRDLSDDTALLAAISAGITSADCTGHLSNFIPKIKATADRPRRFYWTEKSDEQEIAEAEEEAAIPAAAAPAEAAAPQKLSEHDLYPLLAKFLQAEMRIYAMRINETTSSNRHGPNGNKWLHPDIVGLKDFSKNWRPEIRETAGKFAYDRINLYSYEMKRKINRVNLREVFFQAVSNSSWANYGYLVAAELDAKAESELRLLANAHGIGFILLNTEQPEESQILIESEERDIDWDTVNRIAEENKDFRKYMKAVHQVCNNTPPEDQKIWYEAEPDEY